MANQAKKRTDYERTKTGEMQLGKTGNCESLCANEGPYIKMMLRDVQNHPTIDPQT